MNRYVVRYRYTFQDQDEFIDETEYQIIDTDTKEQAEKYILNWGKSREYNLTILSIEQSVVKVFTVEEAEKNFSKEIISKIEEGHFKFSTRLPYESKISENYSEVEFDEVMKQKLGCNGIMGFYYDRIEDLFDPDNLFKQKNIIIDHYETF